MTRLENRDIDHIARHLDEYDDHLTRMTGASLRKIACMAAGVDEALLVDLVDRVRIAAVPVSSGLGVIGEFSETVAAIVSHLGFHSFVTESRDVSGIAEAFERGADILMLADDDRFVALTAGRKHLVDNNLATARGFVAGLELMSGGVAGASVLVLGCGSVGVAATKVLIDGGADVALCDIDHQRALAALMEIGQYASGQFRAEEDPQTAVEHYELIFDATDAGDFIEPAHLSPDTMVAAPGIPCGLTPEAMTVHGDRVLHDVLEIGTATMAVQAAADFAATAKTKKAAR